MYDRYAIPNDTKRALLTAVRRRRCPLTAAQVAERSGSPLAAIEALTDQLPHVVTPAGPRYPALLPAAIRYCGSVSVAAESYALSAERQRLREAGAPRELLPRKFRAARPPMPRPPGQRRPRRPLVLDNAHLLTTTQAAQMLGISARELGEALAWLPHSTVPTQRGAKPRVVIDTRDLALLGLLTDDEVHRWATRRPGESPAERLAVPVALNRRGAARVLRCRVPAVPAAASRYGVRPVVAGTGPLGRGELWRRDALAAAVANAANANGADL